MTPLPAPPATSPGDIDDAFAALSAGATRWAQTPVRTRRALLDELIATTYAAAGGWVSASAESSRHGGPGAPGADAWYVDLIPVLRNLALLRRTLDDIDTTGAPQPPRVTTRADGRVVVDVHPAHRADRIVLRGFDAQVLLGEHVTAEQAGARMGRAHRDPRPGAAVALVLAPGNVMSVAAMDVLHQVFGQARAVLLKPSPVNDALAPHLGEAFEPLVREGLLRIVHGDDATGARLVADERVDAIHLTGTTSTYEDVRASVAGRTSSPVDVAMTAALDGITPVIVVPGPWSDRDVTTHADAITSMLGVNAGRTCVAPRLLVQHRSWSRRRPLLEAIASSMRQLPASTFDHPGAAARRLALLDNGKRGEGFARQADGTPSFGLVTDLDPGEPDDPLFTDAQFSGVLADVGLDAPRSIPDFVRAAVELCNEQVAGSLAATIIVHPRSLLDAGVALAVERAIEELQFGTVVVNHLPGVAFGLASTPWGAAPTGDEATGSGAGFVHNTFMLDDVEKSIVRGPFRTAVAPPWQQSNRLRAPLGRALATAMVAPVRRRSADEPTSIG